MVDFFILPTLLIQTSISYRLRQMLRLYIITFRQVAMVWFTFKMQS